MGGQVVEIGWKDDGKYSLLLERCRPSGLLTDWVRELNEPRLDADREHRLPVDNEPWLDAEDIDSVLVDKLEETHGGKGKNKFSASPF